MVAELKQMIGVNQTLNHVLKINMKIYWPQNLIEFVSVSSRDVNNANLLFRIIDMQSLSVLESNNTLTLTNYSTNVPPAGEIWEVFHR